MRTSILWMLSLLTVVSALAGTHVNISISQQHSKTAAQVADSSVMGDKVQLRSDAADEFRSNSQYNSGRSARLELKEKDSDENKHKNHKVEGASMNGRVMVDRNSERVHLVYPHNHQRSMYHMSPIEYQRNGQFRQMNNQQKQNMEFERYIQNYHSSPTVQTVYESADMMTPHSGSSRVNDASHGQQSAKLVQFERQVALPAQVASSENQHQHQSVQVSEKSSAAPVVETSASSSSSSAASASAHPSANVPGSAVVGVSTPSGNNFHININQRPTSVGSDGLNFDQPSPSYNKPTYNEPSLTSYNKPSYNEPTLTSYNKPTYNEPTPTFKYNNDDSDIHFQNQYPPSVEEPQGGYGGYYHPSFSSNGYDQHYGGHNYLPPEAPSQRPVVTKTIQIAQPAIKTKKYEVRHPAIQKEFYDIEERVLIKPAGTVVVELERPVAKIPKGESILPLGHPHPAVAGAYMNNGNNPSFSNIIYSAAGGSHQSQPNNQYNPSSDYSGKHVPGSGSTIASSITSNPRYDQGSQEQAVEANLNKQYSGDSHYTATAAPVIAEDSKPKNREVIVVTDGQGNQRQVSSDQFSYSRDEPDKVPSRSVYNLRSYASHNNGAHQRSNYQPSHSNRNDYNFDAEYISNAGNTNSQRESKPARLEEAPVRMSDHHQQSVIKHNIHVAPSQHKIYLTRNDDMPQSRYVDETARVQEVKPYLRSHRGPVVVYAANRPRLEMPFRQAADFRPQSQIVQFRNSERSFHKAAENNRPEISAPYSQMRYHPEEHNLRRGYSSNENESRKYGQLILENSSGNEMKSDEKKEMNKPHHNNTMMDSQTSIEIKIPQSSQNSYEPIVVSSTMRPMMSDDGNTMHNSKLEISITNNGEPKEEHMMKEDQMAKEKEHLAEAHNGEDCDKKGNMDHEQKFMRIVEAPADSNSKDSGLHTDAVASSIKTPNVDVHNKGTSGHHAVPETPGSRVIAATPAPNDAASASESFHKRRIVVNHPFQTVREVVEHEPYTNYHEVQVNEPASPYHSANYFQTHGSLRDGREDHHHMNAPIYYQ